MERMHDAYLRQIDRHVERVARNVGCHDLDGSDRRRRDELDDRMTRPTWLQRSSRAASRAAHVKSQIGPKTRKQHDNGPNDRFVFTYFFRELNMN